MKKLWRVFNGKEEKQQFEAMQVEVSATCNLRCTFCPTTYQHHQGKPTMSIELFKKLAPYFSWFEWVYLQGWGEPLLHQDFWQMVHLAKEAGVKVGFTTNGTLLNQNAIGNIFANGVDLVSTSIAGATEESHSRLRVGSSLERIGKNIKMLIDQRRARGLTFPKVSISYMLTKDSIHELPKALKLAMGWGVDDFYTTHLDYVFSHLADEQRIFSIKDGEQKDSREMEPELKKYQDYVNTASHLASKEKVSFRPCKLVSKEQEASCELNPNKFVFITAQGEVTSCTYLGRMENSKIFRGQPFLFPRQSFGNIQQTDFGQILSSQEYINFCEPFRKRNQALKQLLSKYNDYEPSLIRIQQAEEEYSKQLKENPLPSPCQVCLKSYGI